MKRFFVTVLMSFMFFSNSASAADTPAPDSATPGLATSEQLSKSTEFLSLSGIRAAIRDRLISDMFMAYEYLFDKANPPEELKSAVERFIDKKLLPQCAGYYAEAFSESELDDLIAFYKSPAGRKHSAMDAEISGKIVLDIQAAVLVDHDELKEIIKPFASNEPEPPAPEPPAPEPPLPEATTPDAASRAVSVSFRLVEEAGSPGFEKAVDPKTGGVIFLGAEAVIDNDAVKEARVTADSVWKEPVVEITLNEMAKLKFSDFTAENAGRRLAILVDGKVVNTPMIRERIASGTCIISGSFTQQEAERIAAGILLAPEKQAEIIYRTPEEAVQAYFLAMRDGGLAATGRLLHPEALARFREILLPLVEIQDSDGQNLIMSVFFGADATIDSVRAKKPLEFYTSFMNVASVMSGMSLVNIGGFEIVGSVAEGDMVHVVVRGQASAGPITTGGMEVASLKRDGEGWKILLNRNIEGFAEALRQLGNQKPDNSPSNSPDNSPKNYDDDIFDIEDF
ncbi:MAG: DUF2059 domain-containing protein [Nitrospirae bacterium]|nr:DUF2059 domain-containing protein [Nitrospirota bacterium]